MRARIEDIEYHLPDRIVTNEELGRAHPDWDMEKVAEKSGVFQRRRAGQDETALDLAIAACEQLLKRHDPDELDGIIFCTQTPDLVLPSNAFLLHSHLRLRENILAFDFNLACSGYVYGLAIARGFIASGQAGRLLLVTADTYSKLIHEGDRSARVLFGDGAAATIVARSASSRGIEDISLATAGKYYERFYVPAGGCRRPKSAATAIPRADGSGNLRSAENIHMDGMGVWAYINSAVPRQVRELLERNGLETKDIDLVIFHQASRMTIDSLVTKLGLSRDQVFTNLERIGNTVSSSIPIALKDAWDRDKVRPGSRILLCGFGAGLSAGTVLMRF